jgi:CRP-like cAMP-binding protein
MRNVAIERLRTFVELSAWDEHALKDLMADMHIVEAHQIIVHEGDIPKNVHIVIDGFACRYKVLPDGKRQILDFVIPGDICDGHMIVMAEMDHNVGTLSRCTIAHTRHQALSN